MPATATRKKKKKAPMSACQAVLLLEPGNFDEQMITAIVGDRVVDSMTVVANEFGVSPQTVRGAWRPHGMPGKRGQYRLAEILLWRLNHLEQNRQHLEARKDTYNEQLRQLEIQERELKLSVARTNYSRQHGNLVDVFQARAEVFAILTVVRDTILKVPSAITPILPAELVGVVSKEIDKKLRHALTAARTRAERLSWDDSSQSVVGDSALSNSTTNGKAMQNGRPKRK